MMEPMNWESLIRELRDFGLTQQSIASSVGVTQPTISALAAGKATKPSFELGNKLVQLHARTKRKQPKAAA